MAGDKIDPQLRDEMTRIEQSGAADARLPVIVEPARRTAARAGEDDTMERLEARAGAALAPLRDRLLAIGAVDVQQLTMASALAASLTPAQIRELADDPLVGRIVSNAPRHVTL